jgi:hypothetical protein
MRMAKPSDYPGFKALLAEWNQKLSDSGFHDVEQTFHDERILKRSGTIRRYERLDPITREARFEYFRRVAQRVSQTHFESEMERQILFLYSQGHSQLAIQRMLGIPGHRCKVYYPLYRWLRAWGLK